MSDEVSLRCSNREVILFHLDTKELMNPYQLNWMAHWSQASSSPSPILENSPTSYHMLNSSDVRGGNIGKVGNDLHSVPPVNCENFTSYHLQNSNGSSSDWTHFPMFEINRKIESIMSTKREASLTHIKAKIDEQILSLSKKSSFALNLTQSAYESHLLHQDYTNSHKTVAISKPNYMSTCSENMLHLSSKQIDNLENLNKSLISCPKETDRECSNEQEFLFGRNEKCLLITNGTNQGEGSKVCTYAKNKRRFFFEKLTVPKVLNMKCSTDNQLMKKYTKPLVLSDDMNTDIPGTSKSHQAESSGSQKVPQNDNPKILEIEEDSDTSRTKTTSTDSKRPSNSPKEITHSDSEPSSRWLKRLRASPLDPIPLNTKRFKKGNVSSSSEMQNLLARVVNYNKSISKNVECSQVVDSFNENIWIKRWCKSSNSKKDALVLCEPENTKLTNEKYEAKQFPSLAAMALMGKQVINFRPCEFQKKGSATVWKIDRI